MLYSHSTIEGQNMNLQKFLINAVWENYCVQWKQKLYYKLRRADLGFVFKVF